jgi:hypothetical protein
LEIVGCGEDSKELIEDQHDISVNSTPNDIMATIVTAMQHAKSVAEVGGSIQLLRLCSLTSKPANPPM